MQIKLLLNFKNFLLTSSLKECTDRYLEVKMSTDELTVTMSDFVVSFSTCTKSQKTNVEYVIISKITYLNQRLYTTVFDTIDTNSKLLEINNDLIFFNIMKKYPVKLINNENGFVFVYDKKKFIIQPSLNCVTIQVFQIGTPIFYKKDKTNSLKIISNRNYKLFINIEKEFIGNMIHEIHNQLQIDIYDIINVGHFSIDIMDQINVFFCNKQIEKYIFADAIFKEDYSVVDYYFSKMGQSILNFITDTNWIVPIYELEYLESSISKNPSLFLMLCQGNIFLTIHNYTMFEKQLNSDLLKLFMSDDCIGLKLLLEKLYIHSRMSDVSNIVKFLIKKNNNLGKIMFDIYREIDTFHKKHYIGYEHWDLDDILVDV